MEIRNVLLARALQVIKSNSGTIGYFPEIVQEIKNRYGFLGVPSDEALVPSDTPKGVEFKHGRLITSDGRKIIIDRLTLFSDGAVADATSSTDDMDLVLDDLASWARSALPKLAVFGPRFYVSNLEIKMTALEEYAPAFRPIGNRITSLLSSYSIDAVPRYEVATVNLYFDPVGKQQPYPGAFSIDRRQSVPYEDNIWFSQAPLKTADHATILQELEETSVKQMR